ncbi:hypothetical protein AU05_09680 [Ectopseudomonas composti]|uniref:FecR family protein n=1 Tax=Ectopseudomonas composti TaxID=658457 RepID=A0ABP3C016_9GAMM|nr:FecR domain-containing protein [Pseudomonas composti]EZH81647.1 hypothetical protein AU05_09680 [Pseudomonas composti]
MTAEADLRSQAREWLVLLNSGQASAADRAAAERWRQTSAEHASALAEVERLWALLGQVERPAAIVQAMPRPKRRWPLPLATAACLLLALWLTPPGWHADVRTQAGEVREVRLDDGSVLQLNGATSLDWNANVDGERRVRLYRGQADFQVAADVAHPFIIEAGEARIRVTGTRFDVNLLGNQVLLAVSEGHVQVSDADGRERAVQAGEQVAWLGGRLQSLQPLDAARALAWQRGRLVFRDRPLPEVFEELQRQQTQQVLFLDAAARELKVTGVFALNDPQAVLRAIETALPVKLTRLPGVLLVSSDG